LDTSTPCQFFECTTPARVLNATRRACLAISKVRYCVVIVLGSLAFQPCDGASPQPFRAPGDRLPLDCWSCGCAVRRTRLSRHRLVRGHTSFASGSTSDTPPSLCLHRPHSHSRWQLRR